MPHEGGSGSADAGSYSDAENIIHYAKCYTNLRIGWDFATVMADSKDAPFPAIFHGKDLYVWRAYRFLCGDSDPDVEMSVSIASGKVPGKDTINAMLVNAEGDCGVISRHTGYRKSVVESYEKLFFNVRDRLNDHVFLASHVYPDSRLVEMYEDYIERSDVKDLLLRAGYGQSIDHVLYVSGIGGGHPYKGYNANDAMSEFDTMFMRNGLFAISMGFINQRRNSMAISNARLSMQAAKMGNEASAGDSVFNSIGSTVLDEISTLTHKKAEIMASQSQQ